MRIAITHPYCWPYVRRGNERNIEELARWLTSRGHTVTTVSTKTGAAAVEHTEYGDRILHRALAGPLLARLRLDERQTFFVGSYRSLTAVQADVVHSWYFSDGLAATYARRRARHRAILQINGVPVPGYSCYRWFPPDAWTNREAARRADAAIACSQFIRNLAQERYGIDAAVIPPPVNMDRYELGAGPPNGRPTIAAVADFNVRRKGIRVLIRAFTLVKSQVPDVLLRIAGALSDAVRAEVLRDLPENVRTAIEILGPQDSRVIVKLYCESSILVLPSMWEPSGTVLIEAMSSGTPVVTTNHAGNPEFVTPETGVLFDPRTNGEETENAAGLADAILRGLALSEQNGIRERCRAQAARFSWPVLGPRIEQVYGFEGAPRA
ncbi:MAG TPA: glycosyltransferase family 4 protein [Bryobacteraceae bacterium]|nr:glycosyltransferase family 4 protein [Bryobacteraceae bacterium]